MWYVGKLPLGVVVRFSGKKGKKHGVFDFGCVFGVSGQSNGLLLLT